MKAPLQSGKSFGSAATQRVSAPSKTIIDNRATTVKQLKIKFLVDNRASKPTLQRVASGQGDTESVVQRTAGKTIKNVLSLGIRKAYVNHKRKKRERAQALLVDNSMEAFVKAYEACRFYHNIYEAKNKPLIEEHGLLIKSERDKLANRLHIDPITGLTATTLDKYMQGDENRGVFLGPKRFRAINNDVLKGEDVRLYLTSNQAKRREATNRTPGQNEQLMPEGAEGLYRDPNYGGGFYSKVSIPANQVTSKNIQSLLDDDDPKLVTILEAISSHYPEGTAPSQAVLRQLLQRAISEDNPVSNKRRLSNAHLDNL